MRTELSGCIEVAEAMMEQLARWTRPSTQMIHPIVHNAMLLGTRWVGEGVRLELISRPDLWPAVQAMAAPRDDLRVEVE